MAIGFDPGTFNLVVTKRGKESGEIKCKREINAFMKLPLENRYMFNMLKKAGIALIERQKVAYVVGEAAVNMAYTLNVDLSRPMREGTINPQESDAFEILKIMIHSLIGEIEKDEVLYYCVPADAVNSDTNATYHQKVLEQIFKAYSWKGKSLNAFPINEALALIYAELADKHYSGIGMSFGGGLVNFCYAIFSQPAITFSVCGSGDWVDTQVAKATNNPVTVVNKEKMSIDLLKSPTSPLERALVTTYRILVEQTISHAREALMRSETKVRSTDPVDIVLGGGVVSPNGFEHLVREVINSCDFPIQIGDIIKPKDHLFSVARGLLVAAENHQ